MYFLFAVFAGKILTIETVPLKLARRYWEGPEVDPDQTYFPDEYLRHILYITRIYFISGNPEEELIGRLLLSCMFITWCINCMHTWGTRFSFHMTHISVIIAAICSAGIRQTLQFSTADVSVNDCLLVKTSLFEQ